MAADYGEIKVVSATIPSGAGTSSGINPGGFRRFALLVPVLTSAQLTYIGTNTGGAFTPFRDSVGGAYSANTPGGTGGALLGDAALSFLAGYANGEVRVSAAAAQAADRSFVWYLKG